MANVIILNRIDRRKAMASSKETSWADQWDPKPMHTYPIPDAGKSTGKFDETLDRAKDAATVGFKKVKAGTAAGIRWIKQKYHKTIQKH
ncbi:hypothetical protein M569_13633 [Genlisea aurea]|uniref:Uncharacterized protein n=1 Tax=Genlisea aurea TaxID=192259 RepID=S8C9Y2_9LAMI|nr:hypothetical protein M569_13633 [Genlisea aurea]